MNIKDKWIALHFMELTRLEALKKGITDCEKCDAYILELKKEIRAYNHRIKDRRVITSDCDSYIELVDVPEGVEDVDEWFDENERRICYPSQYDCTGQLFTMWYKVCRRGSGFKVYHKVGMDV